MTDIKRSDVPALHPAMLLAALALLLPASTLAGDVAAGRDKAAVCAACHGKNGQAQIPSYPNLAGQNEEYLQRALQAYKSGQRKGGMATLMQGQTAILSDDDIADLAAYYASLPADGDKKNAQ